MCFLNKGSIYFWFIWHIFSFYDIYAQLSPPKLRCVSVLTSTSAVLSWETPPIPAGALTEYQIWTSATQIGPFSLVGRVNIPTQTSFTHSPTSVGSQSQYYFLTTTINGTNTSVASDTLRSLFLNLSNPGNGIVNLNWNSIDKTPSSILSYTVSREFPRNLWTKVYFGNKLNYKDTTDRCKVFYNYKVEISASTGCVSQSNIKGDTCKNLQPPAILELDSVTVNQNSQSVIGWSKSAATDVDRYVIFKSNGGILIPIDTILGRNNTSYIYLLSKANNAPEGFCISAIDSCGNYSIPSLTHNSMFLSPANYDSCSNAVSLTWTSYNNLKKGILCYEIFSSLNGAPYTSVGTTTLTTFSYKQVHKVGTWCYLIRVSNSDKSISASSNSVCFISKAVLAPAFVYINSVSVAPDNHNIELTFTIDSNYSYKGCNIYRSVDGLTFLQKSFIPFSSSRTLLYVDYDVNTEVKAYFYKVQIIDNCNNLGVESNISKNIILKVNKNDDNLFLNQLVWDDYLGWSGGVKSYNIYRGVNGEIDTIPIINLSAPINTYVDNIQEFSLEEGTFSYYIEAVEGVGNIYGFKNKSMSNFANAYVDGQIFIPNAFAPNGINNVWKPILQFIDKTDYHVKVFNRWGNVVFETQNYQEGWTGENAQDMVYTYLIEFKNSRGEFVQKKGYLTLVK